MQYVSWTLLGKKVSYHQQDAEHAERNLAINLQEAVGPFPVFICTAFVFSAHARICTIPYLKTLTCVKVSAEDKANFFTVTNTRMAGSKRGEFQNQTSSICPCIKPTIHPSTHLLKKRESGSANCSCSSLSKVS